MPPSIFTRDCAMVIFWFSPMNHIEINGFLYGQSIMGLTCPYIDGYNVYQVLIQTSSKEQIQFYGNEL